MVPWADVSRKFSDESLVLSWTALLVSYLCYFIAPYTSLDTVDVESHVTPLLPLSVNFPEQRLT